MAARSLIDLTQNYTDFLRQYQAYLRRVSSEEYSERAFAWFRPKDFGEVTDLKKVSEAFPCEELQEAAQDFVKDATENAGSDGDYALLAAQHDLLVSANRSFASRHRSKLRHYAAAAGVQDRVGGEYGTLHYAYEVPLTNVKRVAASASQ